MTSESCQAALSQNSRSNCRPDPQGMGSGYRGLDASIVRDPIVVSSVRATRGFSAEPAPWPPSPFGLTGGETSQRFRSRTSRLPLVRMCSGCAFDAPGRLDAGGPSQRHRGRGFRSRIRSKTARRTSPSRHVGSELPWLPSVASSSTFLTLAWTWFRSSSGPRESVDELDLSSRRMIRPVMRCAHANVDARCPTIESPLRCSRARSRLSSR